MNFDVPPTQKGPEKEDELNSQLESSKEKTTESPKDAKDILRKMDKTLYLNFIGDQIKVNCDDITSEEASVIEKELNEIAQKTVLLKENDAVFGNDHGGKQKMSAVLYEYIVEKNNHDIHSDKILNIIESAQETAI